MHRLLVHLYQLLIHHDLIELRFHRRDQLVQNISECEVSAVSLKKAATDLRPTCAVKNELRSSDANGVGYVARLNIRNRSRCSRQRYLNVSDLRRRRFEKGCSPCSSARCCTTCPSCRPENPRANEV